MLLDEFLIKLGVVTDINKVEKFKKSLVSVTKIASLVATALTGMAAATVKSFNNSLKGAEELSKKKGQLFNISRKELTQSKQYLESLERLGVGFESIKTRVALGFLPTLSRLTNEFQNFLNANKHLIADGITKVVGWLFRIIQVFGNAFKFINKLVTGTIGWKNALYLLAAALALIKRRMLLVFIASPVGLVVTAIAGLLLLVDDLMVYLNGGNSLLGKYWGAFFDWIEKVKTSHAGLIEGVKKFAGDATKIIKKLFGNAKQQFNGVVTIVRGVVRLITGLFNGNRDDVIKALSMIWTGAKNIFFGLLGSLKTIFIDGAILLMGLLGPATRKVFETMGTIIGNLMGMIVEGIGKKIDEAIEWFWELFDSVVETGNDWLDDLKGVFNKVINIIKKPFAEAFKWVEDLYNKTIGKIMDGINKMKRLVGFGEDTNFPTKENIISLKEINAPDFGLGKGTAFNNHFGKGRTVENNYINGDTNNTIHITSDNPQQVAKIVEKTLNKPSTAEARASRNLNNKVQK